MKRIYSIDFMRGLVMIIMTLDHVRDFMHTNSIAQSPTDLSTTTPILFFTRWVTHLCAPTFVFLSGTSAYISMKQKNNVAESKKFLLKRGVWLIVLDLTLINFGLWFDIHFSVFLFDVLSAIGVGFMVVSLLIKTSLKTILLIGLAIISLHNLVFFIPNTDATLTGKILMACFTPEVFQPGKQTTLIIGYSPLPWLGVILVGFAAGKLFELQEAKRKAIFLKTGLSAIGLFLILRCINNYGDNVPWSMQKSGLFSLLSFINVNKYPPSLDFCLLFLGIMFIILSIIQSIQNRWANVVCVYGKVPLFYFLIHWYIIHPLLFLILFLQGFTISDMVFGTNFGRPKTGGGIQLWAVYVIWIVVVILLYPVCRQYNKYRGMHREKKWLRYF